MVNVYNIDNKYCILINWEDKTFEAIEINSNTFISDCIVYQNIEGDVNVSDLQS